METDEQHPAFNVSYVRSKIWTPVCAEIIRRERTIDLDISQHPLYARRPDLLRRHVSKNLPGGSGGGTWVSEWLQRRFEKPRMSEPQLPNRPKVELPPCTPGRVIKQNHRSALLGTAGARRHRDQQNHTHHQADDLNDEDYQLLLDNDDSCCEDCCFCCPGRRRSENARRQLTKGLTDQRSASIALPISHSELSRVSDRNFSVGLETRRGVKSSVTDVPPLPLAALNTASAACLTDESRLTLLSCRSDLSAECDVPQLAVDKTDTKSRGDRQGEESSKTRRVTLKLDGEVYQSSSHREFQRDNEGATKPKLSTPSPDSDAESGDKTSKQQNPIDQCKSASNTERAKLNEDKINKIKIQEQRSQEVEAGNSVLKKEVDEASTTATIQNDGRSKSRSHSVQTNMDIVLPLNLPESDNIPKVAAESPAQLSTEKSVPSRNQTDKQLEQDKQVQQHHSEQLQQIGNDNRLSLQIKEPFARKNSIKDAEQSDSETSSGDESSDEEEIDNGNGTTSLMEAGQLGSPEDQPIWPTESQQEVMQAILNSDPAETSFAISEPAGDNPKPAAIDSPVLEAAELDEDSNEVDELGEDKPQLIIQSFPLSASPSAARDSPDTFRRSSVIAQGPTLQLMWRNLRRSSTVKRWPSQPELTTHSAQMRRQSVARSGSIGGLQSVNSTSDLSEAKGIRNATVKASEAESPDETILVEQTRQTKATPSATSSGHSSHINMTASKPIHQGKPADARRDSIVAAIAAAAAASRRRSSLAGTDSWRSMRQSRASIVDDGSNDNNNGNPNGTELDGIGQRQASLIVMPVMEEDEVFDDAEPEQESTKHAAKESKNKHRKRTDGAEKDKNAGAIEDECQEPANGDQAQQQHADTSDAETLGMQNYQNQAESGDKESEQQQPTVILIRRKKRSRNVLQNAVPNAQIANNNQENGDNDEEFKFLTNQEQMTSQQEAVAKKPDEQINVTLKLPAQHAIPVVRKRRDTSINWFTELPSKADQAARKSASKSSSGPLTTRFELPFDLRDLESMEPQDYIRKFSVISSRRQFLYQKLFQKYRNPATNCVGVKDLERCLSDLLVGGIAREQLDQALELCGLVEPSPQSKEHSQQQLDSRLFYAFCAVVERLTTGQRPPDGVERDGCRKQQLEAADFTCLPFKLRNVQLSDKMHRLLSIL